MPLIILGLLLLICILAYAIVRYINSADEDQRPVRERYPQAFSSRSHEAGTEGSSGSDNQTDSKGSSDEDIVIDASSYVEEDSLRGDIEHMLRNLAMDVKKAAREKNFDIDEIRKKFGFGPDEDEEDNTVEFPKDNIENEKKKRGIHSD